MILPTTQLESESLPQQGRISPAPDEVTVVVGTDASVRLLNRSVRTELATKKPCVVYNTTAIAQAPTQSKCSGFDEFVRELEANPQDAQRLKEANRWVAEKFYAEELTLAALRLAAGLSQRGLAAATGLEQSHISRYESGRIVPGTDIGSKLARALGITLDEFEQARVRSFARSNRVKE